MRMYTTPFGRPVRRFPSASGCARSVLFGLAILSLASCASQGVVRSGAGAVYSTGLSVTLVSWKDGADLYAGKAADGRWLIAEVRVDYDGNAQYGEIPAEALKISWNRPDGSKGLSAPLWVYDPTPGVGLNAAASLRVRVSNRFTLAFDLPAGASPASLSVGDASIPLSPPEP